jgi:tetratricopeptide (TPR) repeat protein
MKRVGAWLLVVVAAWGAWQCQLHLDEHSSGDTVGEEELYFSDPAIIRRLCLSYSSMVADFYWLRTIQYYGGKDRSRQDVRYDLLLPLLKIVTALDPQMVLVYRFGAIFLSEPRPIGAGDVPSALQLLDEGIARNPDAWNLLFDKGFIYFWQQKDYNQAAEWFFRASRHPKASPEIEKLAQNTIGRQGDMDTAERLWRRQYEDAPNTKMRLNALRNLTNMQFHRELWTLEWMTDRFYRQEGRFPKSWEELIERGWLKEIPKDPFGENFQWNAQEAKVVPSSNTAVGISPLPEVFKKNFLSRLDQRSQGSSSP